MSEDTDVCRLCTSTKMLKNLYNAGDLSSRTSSCIGIKLNPDDGLTPLICEVCEQTINNFYIFKQNCLVIDLKLRCYINSKELIQSTKHIKQKSESSANYLKNTYFVSCIEDNKQEDIDEEALEYSSGDENTNKNDIPGQNLVTSNDNDRLPKKVCYKDVKLEKYLCELCGNLFKTKQILEKHSVTHTGVRNFSCKLCPKQFTRAAHKVVHMRKHMGIKPYTCEICGKPSIKRQDLNRHLRIHSDEKKYPCLQCNKRFKRSSDVHAHMRTHTGARPFKCSDCDMCYTSHSGLKKHLHRTHYKKEEKPK